MNTNETVLEIKTYLTNIQEKCHRQLHSHFNNLLKKRVKIMSILKLRRMAGQQIIINIRSALNF